MGYLGNEVKDWLMRVVKINCDEKDQGSGVTSNFGPPQDIRIGLK